MEALKRSRRPIRREFDKLYDDLVGDLKANPIEEDVIEVKYRVFLDTYERLRVLDEKVRKQMTIDKLAEAEEDKEHDEMREYKNKVEVLRLQKEKRVSVPSTSTSGVSVASGLKIMPTQLKQFSGELKDWLGWQAQFKKIDEDAQLSGSDKFWHLMQALKPGTDAYEIASGYPQSNENYRKVMDALEKQFGNKDLLLQVYIRELLNLVITNVNSKEKIPMKTLYLKLSSHLRALNTLQLKQADPATWLFPLVESSLPENVLVNWHHDPLSSHDGSKDSPPRNRLDLLMTYLEREVQIKQKMEITKSFSQKQGQEKAPNPLVPFRRSSKPEKRQSVSTLASFHVRDSRKCAFCDKSNHASGECFRAKKMSYDEKISILKRKGLCYRCCGPHMGRDCKAAGMECSFCKLKHLDILCKEFKYRDERENPSAKRRKMEEESLTVASNSNVECGSEVALQTLLVKVIAGGKEKIVRAFIDSGSQRSYISRSVANELGINPIGMERVIHSLFGGQQTSVVTHHKFEVTIRSLCEDDEVTWELRDQDRICGFIPRVDPDSINIVEELRMKGVKLTDVGDGMKQVDLLIGADMYGLILLEHVERLRCGAVAIKTRLGWTLMGKVRSSAFEDSIAVTNLTMTVADACVTQLWELDTLGIRDPVEVRSLKELEEEAYDKFIRNIVRLEDGRYSVRLPWREEMPNIGDNRDVALARLKNTSRKLVENKLWPTYDSILKAWEEEKFIEKAETVTFPRGLHYLPHRGVVKESLTTPIRIVFDASCRTKGGSLNDCLEKGENLLQLIPARLICFREKKVGFVSDIRKAFQMISVENEDRDMLRFLWWKDETMAEVVEYRHTRVIFGATCSPFILGAILKYHLTHLDETRKEIGEKILNTLYVDNCVSSEDSFEEYRQFRNEATEILKSAKMDLRMWLSNLDEFEDVNTHTISVLGMMWDRKRDELFVKSVDCAVPAKVTKRAVLSAVQKPFDPLGLICPATLPIKMLLQRVWIQKLGWDEELPTKEAEIFRKWLEDLHLLERIRIPRNMTMGVRDPRGWSLHAFADASKDAYAVVVFLRVECEEDVSVQLIAAKARVAPVKQLSIPRLELMACLIATRLVKEIRSALGLDGVETIYWSDSTIALAWIRRDNNWRPFVSNRVIEILKTTQKEQWRHVPGKINPADFPSRGCALRQLCKSKWWEGPGWLYQEQSTWPAGEEFPNEDEVLEEQRKSVPKPAVTMIVTETVRNHHSFASLVRVVGWIRRFLYNFCVKDKSKRKSGRLSAEELRNAEMILVRDLQREDGLEEKLTKLNNLEIMKDDWGILRVKTRLTYRNDPISFKYPILLCGRNPQVRTLIMDTHQNYCHAGSGFVRMKLRDKYWILRGQQAVRSVIFKCHRCKRFSAKPTIPSPAPLPLDRVKHAEVFEVVGIDLAGPLFLKNGKKVWFTIFTCAIFRAVHFELISSLSTRAFLNVLAKFVKKYRRPSIIYSDNGTNFRGADNWFSKLDWDEIGRNEETRRIQWKFSPAIAAWWGGWWERLIRTAKDMLKRTVGKASLNLTELDVILQTIADAMNSRPLTHISEDPNELAPLTPNLFLHPFGNVNFPEKELSEAEKLRFRFHHMKTLQKDLKKRFEKEYLALLVNRYMSQPTRDLQVGELVLIGDDMKKRTHWQRGRVVELIRGRDEVIRLARVKVENGEVVRAVQRLYPLELGLEEPYAEKVKEDGYVTKYGRRVKEPKRFQ